MNQFTENWKREVEALAQKLGNGTISIRLTDKDRKLVIDAMCRCSKMLDVTSDEHERVLEIIQKLERSLDD